MKKIILIISTILIAANANAGVVSHSSGYFLTVRDCPTASDEMECISQSIFGPGFITRNQDTTFAENQLVYSNEFSNGTLINDTQNLSLPEFKFEITSDSQQRNGVNLFNYQEFVWTADAATLRFEATFDFIMSNVLWGDSIDSSYNLTLGLYSSVNPASGGGFFPTLEDSLGGLQFSSSEANVVADEKYYGNISVDHAVDTGDSFYLYTQIQAFALNGGYVDSLNTLTSNVSAFDLQGVALDSSVIANSLVAQNRPLAVNAPGTALLLLPLGAILLLRARNK